MQDYVVYETFHLDEHLRKEVPHSITYLREANCKDLEGPGCKLEEY